MGLSSTLRNWFEGDRVRIIEAADRRLTDVVTSGDFTVDSSARKAYLRGEELDLCSAEFDLLRFLLSHPKKLITPRTALLSQAGSTPSRRVEFMSTLLSLRRKLDNAAGAAHYLRTEPWVFYRFSADGERE